MGSLEIAKEMILEAKRCGCDYVKFQKRHLGSIPNTLAMMPYPGENSFGATYLDHRAALEFDGKQWRDLQAFAEEVGIGFFGTAFDFPSAEFLTNLNAPYLKIGSAQIKDSEFIKQIDELWNCPPLIVSTGMCTDEEVLDLEDSLDIAILVHTTSSYPCPEEDVNLSCLKKMRTTAEIGLSGHYTAGNGVIEAVAVAFGATYIERHFTLDRSWKGSDQSASLEPAGMMNVVKAVRSVERVLGNGFKRVMPSEIAVMKKLNIGNANATDIHAGKS